MNAGLDAAGRRAGIRVLGPVVDRAAAEGKPGRDPHRIVVGARGRRRQNDCEREDSRPTLTSFHVLPFSNDSTYHSAAARPIEDAFTVS